MYKAKDNTKNGMIQHQGPFLAVFSPGFLRLDMVEQKFQLFWNLLTNMDLMIPKLPDPMTKILVTKGVCFDFEKAQILMGHHPELSPVKNENVFWNP